MDAREIPLTKGHVALVSPEDYDDVMRRKWRVMDSGNRTTMYALGQLRRETGRQVPIMLHRYLFLAELEDAPKGSVVSHLDGNGLNCTRGNLRITSQAANVQHDKDRHAMQRAAMQARERTRRNAASADYFTRLRTLNERIRAEGLSPADVAQRIGREDVSAFLDGIARSPAFLSDLEAVLGGVPA